MDWQGGDKPAERGFNGPRQTDAKFGSLFDDLEASGCGPEAWGCLLVGAVALLWLAYGSWFLGTGLAGMDNPDAAWFEVTDRLIPAYLVLALISTATAIASTLGLPHGRPCLVAVSGFGLAMGAVVQDHGGFIMATGYLPLFLVALVRWRRPERRGAAVH